ncbi:MAG TPA: hypothetical protein VMI54_11495 [Polyangiaceae bacterium]|nr:hypothetical protein [Polyangiaceae bacterium]
MQRTVSVLLTSLVAGLFMTGCPDKKVEKEDPAAPAAAPGPQPQSHAATDDKAADDEHGDEGAPDEHPDDSKRPHHHRPDKKDQAGDAKDQGGW